MQWPYLSALFDSPDMTGIGMIMTMLQSNHDVLTELNIQLNSFTNQKSTDKNSAKSKSGKYRKNKAIDNIDDAKLTKKSLNLLCKILLRV